MKILISGVGIAGPTLAHWLLRHGGFEVTLVESAPRLRTGGYVVDFWGAGHDIAEEMGLLPALRDCSYQVREVRMVARDGRRVGGFPAGAIRRAVGGRLLSIPRSELASTIYQSIEGRVEALFGDSIIAMEQRPERVDVEFQHAPPRSFDVVIGADGTHSPVRRLAFGADGGFETYLGLQFAAFELPGYRPRAEDAYVIYNQVRQQTDRFSLRGDRTLFLFIFAQPSPDVPAELEERKALLRRRFSGAGWECPQILARLDDAQSLYFDRVSQIRMDRWSTGRVGLVGDSAFAPSFLAGQGSALAMLGAYILAGELKLARRDPHRGLARYHQRLAAFMSRKQHSAVRFADNFAPQSRLGVFLKNRLSSTLALPFVAEGLFRPLMRDRIVRPAY
jgi:2-polyprenyl-6-methoxyphenol hydroxylase-like FAD-dependent oxidoreductase